MAVWGQASSYLSANFPPSQEPEDRQPLPHNLTAQGRFDLSEHEGTAPKKPSLHARCLGESVKVKGEIVDRWIPGDIFIFPFIKCYMRCRK